VKSALEIKENKNSRGADRVEETDCAHSDKERIFLVIAASFGSDRLCKQSPIASFEPTLLTPIEVGGVEVRVFML
jgi:hypothetical protein